MSIAIAPAAMKNPNAGLEGPDKRVTTRALVCGGVPVRGKSQHPTRPPSWVFLL